MADAAVPAGQAPAPAWRSPSALLLVAANLVPLWGVLAWDWPVFPLLVLFWAENVVIGVLNVARMLCASPHKPGMWAQKLFLVPFFCVHYGMFAAGHGAFLFTFFGGDEYEDLTSGLVPLEAALKAAEDQTLWPALAVLALSHLFSFGWNYLRGGEFREAEVEDLMLKPYKRVVLLHVTILVGGMATLAMGSPVWALILLLAMKIGMDLFAHLREHRAAPQTPGR